MIFVSVGTQRFQLNRLLKTIDELVEKNIITESVFAQIGHSDYKPINYEYIDFLDKENFDAYIEKSSVVVTHSGVGTIIAAVNRNKPVVVFPRLAKYDEHVDDHQLQIAEAFGENELVLMCGENDSLEKIIEKARTFEFKKYKSQRENVVNTIREYIRIY